VDGGILLGRRVAERFSAYPGSVVSVVSPGGSRFNASLGAFIPRFWTFEVTGYFETGMYEYDNGYALLPRNVAQRFAGLGDAVSGLEIRLTNPDDAAMVATALEDELRYPYRALDWQTQNAQLFAALRLEKLVFSLVVLLIVIVAAFNIVSMLTMVVTFKTREIGILRAMGFPSTGIRRAFQMQGLAIGGVGTVVGLLLGLAASLALDEWRLIAIDPSVYFIDHLPVENAPFDVAMVIVASVVIALVATIQPARRAAELAPVEAIRHE
jgi:lipoprotein-releasing system permease protein